MKFKRLYLRLHKDKFESFIKRYHFEEQSALFSKIYDKMIRMIQPAIYYEYDYPKTGQVTAIHTLGKRVDEWMDLYQDQGDMLKAYAIECLSLEFLSHSYMQFQEIIYRERRQFLENIHFCDYEELTLIISDFKQKCVSFPISINTAAALTPTKTTVYYGQLGESASCSTHNCHFCDQIHCVFRTFTGDNYDIKRIP